MSGQISPRILGQIGNDTITHIVSILALLAGVVSINLIEFTYGVEVLKVQTTSMYIIGVQNIVFGIGMAYYAVKFAVTPSSVNIQTVDSQKTQVS